MEGIEFTERGIEMPDMGPCCICRKHDKTVRNIMMIERVAPVLGTGWGCLVCGLENDGAVAVICDECSMQDGPFELKDVCYGQASEKRRIPYAELTDEPFTHNMKKHRPEIERNDPPPRYVVGFTFSPEPTIDELRAREGWGCGTLSGSGDPNSRQRFCFVRPVGWHEEQIWPQEWEYFLCNERHERESIEVIGRLVGINVSWSRVILHGHNTMYNHARTEMGEEVYPQ